MHSGRFDREARNTRSLSRNRDGNTTTSYSDLASNFLQAQKSQRNNDPHSGHKDRLTKPLQMNQKVRVNNELDFLLPQKGFKQWMQSTGFESNPEVNKLLHRVKNITAISKRVKTKGAKSVKPIFQDEDLLRKNLRTDVYNAIRVAKDKINAKDMIFDEQEGNILTSVQTEQDNHQNTMKDNLRHKKITSEVIDEQAEDGEKNGLKQLKNNVHFRYTSRKLLLLRSLDTLPSKENIVKTFFNKEVEEGSNSHRELDDNLLRKNCKKIMLIRNHKKGLRDLHQTIKESDSYTNIHSFTQQNFFDKNNNKSPKAPEINFPNSLNNLDKILPSESTTKVEKVPMSLNSIKNDNAVHSIDTFKLTRVKHRPKTRSCTNLKQTPKLGIKQIDGQFIEISTRNKKELGEDSGIQLSYRQSENKLASPVYVNSPRLQTSMGTFPLETNSSAKKVMKIKKKKTSKSNKENVIGSKTSLQDSVDMRINTLNAKDINEEAEVILNSYGYRDPINELKRSSSAHPNKQRERVNMYKGLPRHMMDRTDDALRTFFLKRKNNAENNE